VRRTGGLADTVVDADAVTLADGSATGFGFDAETSDALLGAVQRAAALFVDSAAWQRVVREAMTRDFSWSAAADHYAALYRDLASA
jgi:starch synthase